MVLRGQKVAPLRIRLGNLWCALRSTKERGLCVALWGAPETALIWTCGWWSSELNFKLWHLSQLKRKTNRAFGFRQMVIRGKPSWIRSLAQGRNGALNSRLSASTMSSTPNTDELGMSSGEHRAAKSLQLRTDSEFQDKSEKFCKFSGRSILQSRKKRHKKIPES